MHASVLTLLLGITMASISPCALAKPSEKGPIITRLYQVGKDGKYCVSVTPDESRCVSGVDDNGKPYNYLDTIEGEYVIFENLSDAPHDMVFTGNNQERLPAQYPNAEKAEKLLSVADLKGAMIDCSYHGKMLSVGYKVRDGKLDDSAPVNGHKKSETPFAAAGKKSPNEPTRGLVPTGLADVGSEVVARGDAEQVEALLKARPELLPELVEARPLLAKELIAKGLTDDPLQGGVNDPNQPKLKSILADEALAAALANGTLTPEQLAQVTGKSLKPQGGTAAVSNIGFNDGAQKAVKELSANEVRLGGQTLKVTGLGNSGPKKKLNGLSLALQSLSDEAKRYAEKGSVAMGFAREPASVEGPSLAAFTSDGTAELGTGGFGFYLFLAAVTTLFWIIFLILRRRNRKQSETREQPREEWNKVA